MAIASGMGRFDGRSGGMVLSLVDVGHATPIRTHKMTSFSNRIVCWRELFVGHGLPSSRVGPDCGGTVMGGCARC
jgi:hypothetical protein